MKLFDAIFTQKVTLRNSDFDVCGRLKPSSILDLFQEAATIHAEELGIGFNAFKAHNMLWVLTKVRFKVLKQLTNQQTVNVNTCAYIPERLEFRRDYSITDDSGEVFAVGTSAWAVINAETRKLMRATDIYGDNALATEYLFDGKILRIRDFDGEKSPKTQIAEFSDIDRNGHVNNRRYADYVQNAVKIYGNIKEFQIDYHKEIMPEDSIEFFYLKDGEIVKIKGVHDGTVLFCCEEVFDGNYEM